VPFLLDLALLSRMMYYWISPGSRPFRRCEKSSVEMDFREQPNKHSDTIYFGTKELRHN